ncbi:aminoacyl-tRNA hydrolase [Wolbachia endosymbiont of Howardula sp.]|uniref:aminoacyl-tRNA hydrolase n=1 Tax=Wolbachia endosymbiont of Howardula sp. TaxID=2916816 RepID=UPI00217D769C|nr:aminoacyl-tRNA hydrolase [Wolbachia endosymbiont of Howardula sp.]UWI83381.1 aminoacyl-tRNA hydrolase [Wolbachia endosymbiont of Howardula sp.]
MQLIVGLGNPGIKYQNTYHNIGFLIIGEICKYWAFAPFHKKEDYLITYGHINEFSVLLLQPYSFMNNSGTPISKVINHYPILLDDMIVIHDDIDLEIGRIKVKKGGSTAGHNGLKSIDQAIGSNYLRIRFGVSRPKDHMSVSEYVLSQFSNLDNMTDLIGKISKYIYLMLQGRNIEFINSVK